MKITAKEIDLLVDSMMDKVYDKSYIDKEKKKKAEKEWEKIERLPEIKSFLKLFDNPYVSYIQPSRKIYDLMGLDHQNYYDSIHSKEEFKKYNINRLMGKYTIEYPFEWEVRKELKNMLVIECLGGDNLKEVLGAVTKEIKKKFKLS